MTGYRSEHTGKRAMALVFGERRYQFLDRDREVPAKASSRQIYDSHNIPKLQIDIRP